MLKWKQVFGKIPLQVIGMIHVPALPGTPRHKLSIGETLDFVRHELSIYMKCGVDAVLVENMHDIPYQQPSSMGPDTTAIMTRVCSQVRNMLPASVPAGVQVLAAANKEAIAVALASGLQFVRCEGFVFSHVADEGWTNSCAAELLRYRKTIGSEHVLIFTDIKKKHSSHAVTADLDISETAVAAEFFLSDGIIVTGSGTGCPADTNELSSVKRRTSLPVLIGSGITSENVHQYRDATALIVGSYFKTNGRWDGDLDENKISCLMHHVKSIRSKPNTL